MSLQNSFTITRTEKRSCKKHFKNIYESLFRISAWNIYFQERKTTIWRLP